MKKIYCALMMLAALSLAGCPADTPDSSSDGGSYAVSADAGGSDDSAPDSATDDGSADDGGEVDAFEVDAFDETASDGAPSDGSALVNNGDNDTTIPRVVESKGTIGFSALTLTNPFFKVIADNMEAEAAKHGYDVLLVSADRDAKKQSDHIDDFIVKGVAAIVLNPCDSRALGPAIKKANDAGIPVFTNDIKYNGDVGEVVCHIATDNYQGGKLAGQAMVKVLGESGGEVVILHFPQAESCQLRVKGFTEVLDEHNASGTGSKIEIVNTLNGGGLRDEGFDAAKDAIEKNPQLSAIFAINDPSALGAYAALNSVGKTDQVTIIAFDGQKIGKQAILEGKILCDPIQFPDRMGKKTVEMIIAYFDGDEVPEEILIPSELYYKEDAEKDPELKE